MEIQELATIAGAVGTSVVCAIRYAAKQIEVYKAQAHEERVADREERINRDNKLLNQLDVMNKTNQALLSTNKELAEGQRVLLNEHSVKINNIENTVIAMSEKLTNSIEMSRGGRNGN
nr:hypothetical protein [uncultured Cellulosilyticum sp.]